MTTASDVRAFLSHYDARRSRAYDPPNVIRRVSESEIYDPDSITRAGTDAERGQLARDYAMRAVETSVYSHPATDVPATQDRLAYLLDVADQPTRENPNHELARRILATGSPTYRSAFNKALMSGGNVMALTPEEQRGTALAMSVTTTGGFLVPFAFDPTIIAVGAHAAINPYRRACRVVSIVGSNIWHALTSTAVTAVRGVEALVAAEAGPTLAQPSYTPSKVQTQITYSIEVGQDRPDIGSEMAVLIQEAKDNEEEGAFAVGTGVTTYLNVTGIVPPIATAGSYTAYETAGSTTVTAADLLAIEAALPVRWRMNAAWFMSRPTIRSLQALETTSGQLFNAAILGVGYPAVGNPDNSPWGNTGLKLLGYPVYESPSIVSAKTSHYTFLTFCDPSTYVIVDRVGMDVEFIPFIFGAGQGNLVTGQRALYANWRNAAAPITTTGGILADYKT